MTVKIEMLRYFCVVAEKGSLQAAAEHLGRTPSAVSMMLKQFEEHLDGKLFEKERKNRLTDLGNYVLRQARNELAHFDATVAAIEAYARNPSGLLRIASVPSMVGSVVIPAVETFTNRYPKIRVEIRDMDSGSVVTNLVAGFVELGIASSSERLNGIVQKPLAKDDFGIVCHRKHALVSSSAPVKLSDLEAANCINNGLCASIDDPEVAEFLDCTNLSAQNMLSLIEMLNSGKWFTILPKGVLALQPEMLAFRKIEGLEAKRIVSLLYRKECETLPHILCFKELLETRIRKLGTEL